VPDFALRLYEFYQLLISHAVKVAGLADFLLLGKQVQFAAQQFQSPVGGTRIWLMFAAPLRRLSAPCACSDAAEFRRDRPARAHATSNNQCIATKKRCGGL